MWDAEWGRGLSASNLKELYVHKKAIFLWSIQRSHSGAFSSSVQALLKLQHTEKRDRCREDLPTSQILKSLFFLKHTLFPPLQPLLWIWMLCWVSGPMQVSSWVQAWWVLVTWWRGGPARTCRRSPQKSAPEELRPTRNASSSAHLNADAHSPSDFLIPAPSPEEQEINRWLYGAETVSASLRLSSFNDFHHLK